MKTSIISIMLSAFAFSIRAELRLVNYSISNTRCA